MSIVFCALEAPSPANTTDPIASEDIVIECESNGPPVAAAVVAASASTVLSPWSKMKDKATFIPLSISPEPVKVNWLPIAIVLPPSVPAWLLILNEAEPATDISPAYTEVATKEPANAVSPIFLKLFILITPYCLIVIINNKRSIFTI